MATAFGRTSADSTKSQSSTKRRSRIVSRTQESRVDEELFGPPARLKQMSGNRSWNESRGGVDWSFGSSSINTAADRTKKGRTRSDVVQVITKDLIRTLKVPSTPDPSGMSIIVGESDLERIKRGAKVLTEADRKALIETQKQERARRMDESNARKQTMQNLELARRKNERPSDLEQEATENGEQLLAKAKEKMEEQDDEIKELNELILNAKCHAIRDAQLSEKDEIASAMKEEEVRLDTMMEIDRLRALKEFEEKERQYHIDRLKGAKVLEQQITAREQQRVLDAEKREQETQALLKYLERLQEEDLEQLQKKKQAQIDLMEEVAKCNEEIQQQKTLQREQRKLEDLKIIEYLKDKERREEEAQQELERQKIEKEKEIAQLRALQERAKDKQAERDALRAKRNQEEFEREWRRKEKAEAKKKADTEEMLRIARRQQVEQKEHFLAVQAQRDRTEFERVLNVQRDQMKEEEKKFHIADGRRRAHAAEIRKQVNEREKQLKQERKAYFEEGIKLDQEAKERRRKLDEIKQRKLAELRAAGVPEKYCAEVSRKITAPSTSFITS